MAERLNERQLNGVLYRVIDAMYYQVDSGLESLKPGHREFVTSVRKGALIGFSHGLMAAARFDNQKIEEIRESVGQVIKGIERRKRPEPIDLNSATFRVVVPDDINYATNIYFLKGLELGLGGINQEVCIPYNGSILDFGLTERQLEMQGVA